MRPPNRPTEAKVGIALALKRSWPYNGRPSDADAHWIAALEACPNGKDHGPELWSCDHDHITEDEGWRCAFFAFEMLTEGGENPNDWKW